MRHKSFLTVARHQVVGLGEAFGKRIVAQASMKSLHKPDKHDVETYPVKTQL